SIEEKDIKTTSFNINPVYAWEDKTGKRTLTGYEVNQTINVKIRDLTKVGSIISGATEKGANDVSSLSFIVDDDEKVKEDAKNLAIKDAQAKAKNLEKALGVKMVKIINFSENSYNPVFVSYDSSYKMLNSSAGALEIAPTIQTGQNKITSTVTITYAIK
ncbi:SIMPL domain-containing protein, partial [bacterium]|nr:SIMPL domain-containing protein [bacterium]